MSSDPQAHATAGLAQGKRPPACVLTIFGASGDLTKRKLIPALRADKSMAKRVTEIAIQFKRPPLLLFKASAMEDVSPNVLAMRLQPDEGVSLTFEVKPPGPDIGITPLSLDFKYEQAFGSSPPEAYETLLEDCIKGDSTLFTRQDWVELAWWSLMDPIIQAWQISKPRDFPNYEVGSWGPKDAHDFLHRDGRRWRQP